MSDNEEKIISMESVSNSETKPQTPTSQNTNSKNNGLNALLFIGSFLIVVGSCSLLASAVSDLVKLAILLFITVVFYVAGLLIRRVKILIPAGTAFTCTSLAVMPFLGFAFSEFTSVSPEISWLLTSIIGTVAYIAAALIIKSRVIAFFSMGFIVSLFCSMPTNLHMATLWNYLSVISVSIIANLISFIFKEKVPTAYRDILSHTARWLAVAVAIATIFGTFSLTGYDYSIIFAICLAQFTMSYLATKNYTDEVLARIVVVPFILSLFWYIFPARSSEFAIVAGLVCLAEIAYSFFSSLLRSDQKEREIPFIIIFLILSLFCPLFAVFNSNALISPSIIGLIISSVDLIFTVLFAIFWKQKSWLIASYFLAAIIPLYIDAGDSKGKLALIIYAFEFICFSVFYYFQKNRDKSLENFNLIAFSFLLVVTRMVIGSGVYDYYAMPTQAETIIFNVVALIVPAFSWLIFGLKDDNKNKVEVSVYFFIACLGISSIQLIFPSIGSSSAATLIAQLIAANTILFGLGLMSFYRKDYARGIVAVSIFSWIVLSALVSINSASSIYSYSSWWSAYRKTEFEKNVEILVRLAFLIEEILIAIIGVLKHRKTIFWIAAPIIFIITLDLTQGMMFIWLILLGIGLIAFVIWRLLETQKKQLGAAKPAEAPKTSVDSKPAEAIKPPEETSKN